MIPVVGSATAASGRRSGDDTGILVPTILQMAADSLNYWTSVTCLYDPHWSADPNKDTLPVCLFHVKKITPVYAVEASKKRVILYEPQQDGEITPKDSNNPLRAGVMQTIVDNAVKQPTTYNMEIIVPFQPIGRYAVEGAKMSTDMVSALSDMLNGAGFTSVWESIFSTVISTVKSAKQLMGVAEKLLSMNGASFVNMNSLEAMAASCRTLRMKMWTGFDYKYVMITGMTSDKQPHEDDVFRATLSLQEMPVLAVTRPQSSAVKSANQNWAVNAVRKAAENNIKTMIRAALGEN